MPIAVASAGGGSPPWSYLSTFAAQATSENGATNAALHRAWAHNYLVEAALVASGEALDRAEEAIGRGDSEEALRAIQEAKVANARARVANREERDELQRGARGCGALSDLLRFFQRKIASLNPMKGDR